MSSFTGGGTTENAATLQLAPRDGATPDFGDLKGDFERVITDSQAYQQQCYLNFQTRFSIWDGQSYDGRKHAREGAKVDPTPWDGASDLRTYLVDEAVNSKIALYLTSFRKANIVAIPVEGNDIKRAKTVTNFVRWLIRTQVPGFKREAKLLANYIQEKGAGVVGVFWENKQEKTLQIVTLQDLQQQLGQQGDITALIYAREAEDAILAFFEEVYGASATKARRMLADLRKTGKTDAAVVGKMKSRPVVRAFNLDEDLFISHQATELQTAPAIYRVQYFTPEQLRGFANTDGWDQEWVEGVIEKCRGQIITFATNQQNWPIQRSLLYQDQKLNNLIGVVYAYQRLSDEDGVPGVYCTVFSPQLGPEPGKHDGFAKHGLLGYGHGNYPFVLFRREYLSRKLHDSRGLPEPGQPWQQQIKVHRDSRIDAASMAILPPMCYPISRPPGRWGPGARIGERRTGEYHFADRPMGDINTEKSEEILTNSFYRYCGFVDGNTDPLFAQLKNQNEVEEFLECFNEVFQQVYSLYGQYGPEEVYFRVIGLRRAEPELFQRGPADEQFDWELTFSIDNLDAEKQAKKLEALARVGATFDKYGQFDWSEALVLAVNMIDPNWGEVLIQPKEVGTQKVVDETNTMLAQVFAGVERDIDLNSPPEIMMSVVQNYGQQPDVQQRYQQDEPFRKRLEKIVKQIQFQMQQRQNATIGRYGA